MFTDWTALPINIDRVMGKLALLESSTWLDVQDVFIRAYWYLKPSLDRLCEHTGQARLTLFGWKRFGDIVVVFGAQNSELVIAEFELEAPPPGDPEERVLFRVQLNGRQRMRIAPDSSPPFEPA